MSEERDEKYWFGFRQIHPKPPGRAVACGPYESYKDAKREREKAKAFDCNVSTPFTARTKEEATEKAEKYTD